MSSVRGPIALSILDKYTALVISFASSVIIRKHGGNGYRVCRHANQPRAPCNSK